MSLRLIAEQDLGFILEGDDQGFKWPITLTAPSGNTTTGLTGTSTDISQVIDPDTGTAVSGRLASVAIRVGAIQEQLPADGLPRGVADTTTRPWLVEFDDINGASYRFKVAESNPDRAIGCLTLLLEAYS